MRYLAALDIKLIVIIAGFQFVIVHFCKERVDLIRCPRCRKREYLLSVEVFVAISLYKLDRVGAFDIVIYSDRDRLRALFKVL